MGIIGSPGEAGPRGEPGGTGTMGMPGMYKVQLEAVSS